MTEWPDPAANRAVSVLKTSLRERRLAHGLLLYGPDLEQIERVALEMAGELLQTQSNPLAHPDCFALRPVNKMRRIGVDSTRELIRSLQQSSNQSGAKVALIYDADRMQTEAANAFLKTLEEPPRETTLILLTTRVHSILNTIRSRCLAFNIATPAKPLDIPEWSDWRQAYNHWLQQLQSAPRSKDSVPQLIFGAYGLAARLEGLLRTLADEGWKAERESLPDNLEDIEKDAYEAGYRKSFRSRLFQEIELETHRFALEAHSDAKPLAATHLPAVIQKLESLVKLFEVNLSENVAIENFFLYSLQRWRA